MRNHPPLRWRSSSAVASTMSADGTGGSMFCLRPHRYQRSCCRLLLMPAALLTSTVLGFHGHWSLHRLAVATSFVSWSPPRKQKGQAHRAAPLGWDSLGSLFGRKEVKVPNTLPDVVEALQNSMLAAVKKTLPRVDIELPPGWPLGIEAPLEDPDQWLDGEVPPEEIVRGDREITAGLLSLFQAIKISGVLCLAFRTVKLAKAAKQTWGSKTWGSARILSFTAPPKAAFGGQVGARSGPGVVPRSDFLTQIRQARQEGCTFVAVVAPKVAQLREVAQFEEELIKEGGDADKDMCIVLINARLRGRNLTEGAELRSEMARRFTALFNMRFVGARNQAMVYQALNEDGEATPWVVVRRPEYGSDQRPEVLWQGNREPTADEVKEVVDKL